MDSLSPETLLHAWESGLAQADARGRTAILLGLARADLDGGSIALLTPGARDRSLLTLRAKLFGTLLQGTTHCPLCRAALEFDFRCDAMLQSSAAPEYSPVDAAEVRYEGYVAQVRTPRLADLDAVLAPDLSDDAQHTALLRRLLTAATRDGRPCGFEDLPAAMSVRLDETLALMDTEALPEFELACDDCRHRWTPIFDVADFLWGELDAWASRLLCEVHALARAYAWSEKVLVNMSPWRRQRYLDMLGA